MMATAAVSVRSKRVNRRRQKVNLVVVHGSRELPPEQGNALLLGIGARMDAKRNNTLLHRRLARLERVAPERRSVERAMLAVEERLVKALWVIERSTTEDRPKGYGGRNGVEYCHDHMDTHARYTDAPGGKYDAAPPRPALPESKEITEAKRVQRWLEFIGDHTAARVFSVGAASKRGDSGRRVNWMRVRARLPEFKDYSTRALQGIYTGALREMVAELTAQKSAAS